MSKNRITLEEEVQNKKHLQIKIPLTFASKQRLSKKSQRLKRQNENKIMSYKLKRLPFP